LTRHSKSRLVVALTGILFLGCESPLTQSAGVVTSLSHQLHLPLSLIHSGPSLSAVPEALDENALDDEDCPKARRRGRDSERFPLINSGRTILVRASDLDRAFMLLEAPKQGPPCYPVT
jgi:hypothetical protein